MIGFGVLIERIQHLASSQSFTLRQLTVPLNTGMQCCTVEKLAGVLQLQPAVASPVGVGLDTWKSSHRHNPHPDVKFDRGLFFTS